MISELRLYLPKKPTLTESCLGDKDYCELSTKFKAAHIKIMVFWTAKKTQEAVDAAPQVSGIIWFQAFWFHILRFLEIEWGAKSHGHFRKWVPHLVWISCKTLSINHTLVFSRVNSTYSQPPKKQDIITAWSLTKNYFLGPRARGRSYGQSESLPFPNQSVKSKDIILQVLGTCCYSLQKCISLMDNSGILLDVDTANEASEMLLLHIKSYAWLAAKFDSERLMAFKIRPKFHYLWHQACQIREWRINMGVFATWSDESFLGKIKLVATACHGKTMTSRVYQRYLLCLAMLVYRHNQMEKPSSWLCEF